MNIKSRLEVIMDDSISIITNTQSKENRDHFIRILNRANYLYMKRYREQYIPGYGNNKERQDKR